MEYKIFRNRKIVEVNDMQKIKLIISDIDGTLVDSSEQLPEAFKETVSKCRDAGIQFAFATGRTRELTAPFVKALGITIPCVEANGAYILQGDEILVEHGFSLAPIKDILYQAHAQGLTVTISDTHHERSTLETDYVREHQKFENRFQELLALDDIDWKHDKFHKIMIMDEHQTGQIKAFRDQLQAFTHCYWVTSYSDRAVELGPLNCNKATGMQDLAAYLGIPMGQVMACGDYSNDAEMIASAGIGVAVGNASDEIKTLANYVAKNHFAYGVIEAINAICFQDA